MAQPRRAKGISGPARSANFHADPKSDALAGFLKGHHVAETEESSSSTGAHAANNVVVYLKNLTKPSEVTKLKALGDLLAAVPECPDELLAPSVPNLIERYSEHVFHPNAGIRAQINRVMIAVLQPKGKEVRRAFSSDSERLIGPWLCSMNDSDQGASSSARSLWDLAFPKDKQGAVMGKLLRPALAFFDDNFALVKKPMDDSKTELVERIRLSVLGLATIFSFIEKKSAPEMHAYLMSQSSDDQRVPLKGCRKFLPGQPSCLVAKVPILQVAGWSLLTATTTSSHTLSEASEGMIALLQVSANAAVQEDGFLTCEPAWTFFLSFVKQLSSERPITVANFLDESLIISFLECIIVKKPEAVVPKRRAVLCDSMLPLFAILTKDGSDIFETGYERLTEVLKTLISTSTGPGDQLQLRVIRELFELTSVIQLRGSIPVGGEDALSLIKASLAFLAKAAASTTTSSNVDAAAATLSRSIWKLLGRTDGERLLPSLSKGLLEKAVQPHYLMNCFKSLVLLGADNEEGIEGKSLSTAAQQSLIEAVGKAAFQLEDDVVLPVLASFPPINSATAALLQPFTPSHVPTKLVRFAALQDKRDGDHEQLKVSLQNAVLLGDASAMKETLLTTFGTLTRATAGGGGGATNLSTIQCTMEVLLAQDELTEAEAKSIVDSATDLFSNSLNLDLAEGLLKSLWSRVKVSPILDGISSYLNSLMVDGADDGDDDDEDDDEKESNGDEDEDDDDDDAEESFIFRLKHPDIKAFALELTELLSILSAVVESPTDFNKSRSKSMKNLLSIVFDLVLLLSPFSSAEAYVSSAIQAIVDDSGNQEDEEDEEGDDDDAEHSDPVSYMELWKHRSSIAMESLIDLLTSLHSFCESANLLEDLEGLFEDLQEAVVCGDADKVVCCVSHRTILAMAEIFEITPSVLMDKEHWGCRKNILAVPADDVSLATTMKNCSSDLQFPCQVTLEAARTVISKAESCVILAEILEHGSTDTDKKSSSATAEVPALFADLSSADAFEIVQDLIILKSVAGAALSSRATTCVSRLISHILNDTHLDLMPSFITLPADKLSRPHGPLVYLSVLSHLAEEKKSQGEHLLQKSVGSWFESSSTLTQDPVLCATLVAVNNTLQVHQKLPHVGWTMSFKLKLRASSRAMEEDKLQQSLSSGASNYLKGHALLAVLSLLDCPIQTKTVEAVIKGIRSLNGGVDSLSYCSALLKSMIMINPLDLVGPIVESLNRTVALAHFPTNGRLAVQAPGTPPPSLSSIASISREIVAMGEGIRLHPDLRTNDTLKSTMNLVMFDLLVSSLLRIQSGVQSREDLVDTITCVTRMSPYFNCLTADEIKTLRSSGKSLAVLIKVIFSLHSFIGACGASRIELLGFKNLLQLTTSVCQVGLVAFVGSRNTDLDEIPEELISLVGNPPVPGLRNLEEGTIKFSALRKISSAILRSKKIQLSLLTYLVGAAAYITIAKTGEQIAAAQNKLVSVLNVVGALGLLPLEGSPEAFAKSVRTQSSHFAAGSSEALAYNIKALSEYSEEVKNLRFKLAAGAVSLIPLMLQGPVSRVFRQWYQSLDNAMGGVVEQFITTHVSPTIIQSSLAEILAHSEGETSFEYNDEIKITLSLENRVVAIEFAKEDEAATSIRITIPPSYPLQPPFVSSADTAQSSGGLSAAKYRSWLMKMMSGSTSTVGLWDWVKLYCDNLSQRYEGVDPCPICYAIVSSVDRKLPELSCSVCSNKFHASCLYTWWRNSGQTSCPTCRSPWYSSSQ